MRSCNYFRKCGDDESADNARVLYFRSISSSVRLQNDREFASKFEVKVFTPFCWKFYKFRCTVVCWIWWIISTIFTEYNNIHSRISARSTLVELFCIIHGEISYTFEKDIILKIRRVLPYAFLKLLSLTIHLSQGESNWFRTLGNMSLVSQFA